MYRGSDKMIKEMSDNLVKEIYDPMFMEHYGTSTDQGMTRDYSKKIQSKMISLQKEFIQMDKDNNEYISFDEFFSFFREKNPNITRKEIENLFILFDKNKDQQITINEFVYAYILLEERLILKKTKLNNIKGDLEESLKSYQKKRQNYQSETFNQFNISTQSEFSLNIKEAQNLVSFTTMNQINSKVEISLIVNNQVISKKMTNLQPKTGNPVFDENFLFTIENPNTVIKVEVIDQGSLTGDFIIGNVFLPLDKYTDQLKHDEVYSLFKDDNYSTEKGTIHLIIRYRHNWQKYYDELINKTQNQIERLNNTLYELEGYENDFKQPFGLIVAQKVNDIINKKIFEKSENVNDYRNTMRSSVYVPIKGKNFQSPSLESKSKQNTFSLPISGITNSGLLSVIKEEESKSVRSSTIETLKSKRSLIIITAVCLLLSLLNFTWRNDFINCLFLSVNLFMVHMDKISMKIKTYVLYICIATEVFDLLWLILNYGTWNKGVHNSSSMLLSYVLSFALFGLKGVLGYFYIPSKQ